MYHANTSDTSNYFWPPINYAYGMEGLITIHILTMLISVPGNLLVIVVILQNKTLLDEPAYLLICSVSVADLLVSVISQPMNIALLLTGVEHASKTLNYFLFFCVWGFCGASAFGVVCITIDRYLYIMHPMHYTMLLSRKRTYMMIAMQWCCGFAYGLLPMIDINKSRYVTGIAALVTLMSMTACMAVIYNRVYKNIRRLRQVDVKQMTSKNKRKQNNATITIALIVLIFFICWFPYIITNFIYAARSYNEKSIIRAVYYWSVGLGCWNSSFNVIIYGFKNSTLRNEAKKLLGVKRFQIEPESSKTQKKEQQNGFMKKITSSSNQKDVNDFQPSSKIKSPLKSVQNSVKSFVFSKPKLVNKTVNEPANNNINANDCQIEEVSRESSELSVSTKVTNIETLAASNSQSRLTLSNNRRRSSLSNLQRSRKKYSNHLKPPNTTLSESLPDLRKLLNITREDRTYIRPGYENLAYESDFEDQSSIEHSGERRTEQSLQ